MYKRLAPIVFALAFTLAAVAPPALARGGGGGGGGGNTGGGSGGGHGGRSDGGRSSTIDRTRDSDQNLLDRARRDCNGPHYPSGSMMKLNYAAGTYNCVELGTSRR